MQDRQHDLDERAPALFEPDTLLPTQYFDRLRGRDRSGEWRLMVAILEDAITVYCRQAGACEPYGRKLFEEAEEWIESRDGTWIFSFESICDMTGLDPDYLRRGLRARKEARAGLAAAVSGTPGSRGARRGRPTPSPSRARCRRAA